MKVLYYVYKVVIDVLLHHRTISLYHVDHIRESMEIDFYLRNANRNVNLGFDSVEITVR